MASSVSNYFKSIGNSVKNGVSDILSNNDFISRTIGMNDSYEDLMYIIQSLGREPISLLGKDYVFIFDHVRRNYQQGYSVASMMYGGGNYGCPKFTFYKERPTVKFADPYFDPKDLLDRWMPDFKLQDTRNDYTGIFYAESNDDEVNNKEITNVDGNLGTASNQIVKSFENLMSCDLIRKTNESFKAGQYRTLIARFHTNHEDTKSQDDPTQTANTKKYGMSHGRNLLKYNPTTENGYNNPYCRVWTYHYQYNQMQRAIRPFKTAFNEEGLERAEFVDNYGKGGFRTIESKNYGFEGGSKRLDRYGVLNYENGFVNIAPTAKIKDYFEHKADDKERRSISTKRCMFSIENLAWRDEKNKPDEFDAYGLSAEQKGPLGGRIMWFPPYDLTFNEDVKVKWNSNEFIGRGENIYTYTNTERTGNLSFTLLIDHPSILDYWTGHERNGMSNGGTHLDYGNNGGVDNVDNQENTLLRFFAGCDILTAKPQEYWVRSKTPEVVQNTPNNEPPAPPEPNPTEPDEVKPEKKVLYCLAYYPNNYSGVYDTPNGSKPTVNAIHYLLNGIGTQKYIEPSHCNDCGYEWYPTEAELEESKSHDNKLKCPYCGKRKVSKNLDEVDFAVDINSNANSRGYEMRGNGISVATSTIDATKIKKSYADPVTSDIKGQFLTKSNGDKINVTTSGQEVALAKQIGSKALSMSYASKAAYTTKSPYSWYRKRWYYRVDEDDDVENQDLKPINGGQPNYIDTVSYKYNSKGGYNSKVNELKTEFGIDVTGDNKKLVSLTDMYMALEKGPDDVFAGLYDESNVAFINDIIENESKRYKITKITFYGHASRQGNNISEDVNATRNTKLARNRALTFKSWVSKNNFPGVEDAEVKIWPEGTGTQKNGNKNDVNDPITKLWRSASMVVEYEQSVTEAAQTTDANAQRDADGNIIHDGDKLDENGKIIKTRATRASGDEDIKKAIMFDVDKISFPKDPGLKWEASDWLYNTPEGEALRRTGYTETITVRNEDGSIETKTVHRDVDPTTFTMELASKITGKNYYNNDSVNYDNSFLRDEEMKDVVIGKSTVKRYDNEGEFFELLERNAPFMHHLISEKIKYFDPAYHSISPEGFNARLTFLQQCTRQGPTVGNSDYHAKTAYNLAFGRPPVCVLRLGDFYYTKIIINSINIQYENAQWDMNPEGIGLMPMFAKVSMSFTFLGGSDLAGPISRLQNAVSFNYYANASVYDNRAERVLYSDNGDGREVKYKPFTYPMKNGNRDIKKSTIVGDGKNSITNNNVQLSGEYEEY